MKKIFIRSPYFIEIDEAEQTSAKIEIFLWNKGTTEPTTANYTLTKNIASATQTKIAWNVANYAKEYIKPIAPVTVSVPTEENVNCWCYMRVVSYSDDVEINDETFVCLNGYNQYSDGYNNYSENAVIPLLNPLIKVQKTSSTTPYVNVFYITGTYDFTGITGVTTLNVPSDSVYKIPLTSNLVFDDYFEYLSEEVCEPKYTPLTCTFINRFGGWQYLTFFKANLQSIETTSKEFQLLPSDINYNVLQGQRKAFNKQGKQKVKCNTGWVNENYFELIQDLLLSEVVLLDNKPVIVKSQSADYKTHLKDKNINYEIEFEYNYGLINDVI
jgi:hypothetical protein